VSKRKGQVRQGDLLFVPVRKVSGRQEKNRTVLVQGEATGHAHRLLDNADVFVRTDGTLEVVPRKGGARVGHDEHATVKLVEPVEVPIQQEYDPSEALRMRQVRD